MSSFVAYKLTNSESFTQSIRITRNSNIAHVRVRILKFDNQTSGQYVCKVIDSFNNVLKISEVIDYTTINSIQGTYAHGMMRFDFDSNIRLNHISTQNFTEYKIKFEKVSGTDDLQYISVVKPLEDYMYEMYTDNINEPKSCLDFEIFTYR